MQDWDAEALAAKTDEERLNNLIAAGRRFILVCACRTCRRFITDRDDEYSVSLLAFHEAVRTYDEGKGPFRPFAGMVIKRRLLDYRKSEARHASEISVEPWTLEGESEDGETTPMLTELRKKEAETALTSPAPGENGARDEIDAVQEILRGYGFSFFDLTECSPKAEKTKRACGEAVRALLEAPELMDRLRRGRALPQKELSLRAGVPQKILERHRNYIIAAAEILSGDYPILSGYLSSIRKALEVR